LFPARGIEYGLDINRNFPLHALTRHILAGILLQMKLTALPGNTTENRFAGSLRALKDVTDD